MHSAKFICVFSEDNLELLLVYIASGKIHSLQKVGERVAEWLRRLTRKPKVRTAVGSNPTLDSLVAVRNTSPGRPEPCEGNLVAVAGSCGGPMVKHPWPLLEISLSDFRGQATLNNKYLPAYLVRNTQLDTHKLKSPVVTPRGTSHYPKSRQNCQRNLT